MKDTMKKIQLILAAMCCAAMATGCGVMTLPLTDADYNSGTASGQQTSQTASSSSGTGILGTILGSLGINTGASIVGTWTYQEPSVQFSSDNLLAKAGGTVASAKVVEKIKPYFEKVGFKQGQMSITFKDDKTCTYVIKSKEHAGTYTYDKESGMISIQGTGFQFPDAYVSIVGTQLSMTFDSSKILSLVKGAGSVAGSNSTLGSISTIASAYDGMKTGFLFTRN